MLERKKGKTRNCHVSFLVGNGIVDCVKYYSVTDDQYAGFLAVTATTIHFMESCRRREHDDLLSQ
ncbi:hypothetical protein MASS_4198 [Mycobacteroides abscessus subsp. bolletii 50594]|uniref:Uncharacterized protein n=1 Tax=Mycobacteroides abscessus subsp. bolletii 50594 TaxID=1303024 RepID=A0AB33AG90_9MYCO|nr:hypothetical protein MASS_4198 [Mycobacteroides abscessus subsp. bolletii 50594]